MTTTTEAPMVDPRGTRPIDLAHLLVVTWLDLDPRLTNSNLSTGLLQGFLIALAQATGDPSHCADRFADYAEALTAEREFEAEPYPADCLDPDGRLVRDRDVFLDGRRVAVNRQVDDALLALAGGA